MTINEYQKLVAKKTAKDFTQSDLEAFALHGIVGKIGELHAIYQEAYKGHIFDKLHMRKVCGELCELIAGFCTANGWMLEDIMQLGLENHKKK